MNNNTLPNLMHTQKPIFFDGNAAGTAGIAEMLLQSHGKEYVVHLLPALPKNWQTGTFNGLCTRGAFEINLQWKDRKPILATVLSKAGNQFRIKMNRDIKVLHNGKQIKHSYNSNDGYYTFNTECNEHYTIEFD